jgi:hypothetical protein
VDELKLLAELRHETPSITTAAARSARARLLAAAAGSPASRRRSRMPSGLARRGRRVAAATALALVLTVGVTVTRDTDIDPEHPAQGRSSALLPPVGVANAAELGQRAAAKVVAGQPDLHPRPNQWTYLEVCWATPKHGMGSYGVCPGRETMRWWARIDAKRVATEYRGRIYQHPNFQLSSVYPWPTFAYLRRLPTDPQALLARLYATFSPGGEPPYGKLRFSREEHHRRVFRLAMQLLWANVVPPGVQAAIYQALPMIPGVRLQRDAVDAAGRHGVAFARINDGRVREEIILDPQTYQYLGWRRIAVRDFVDKGSTIAGKKNPHIATGTVLEWQARTAAAIVDRPGQRH